MKKLLVLLCLAIAFPLFAEDAPKPTAPLIVAAAPVEIARVDAIAEGAMRIAQYEKAIAVIIKQRSEADAVARDWQLQAALAAGELAAAKEANEALKKQLAEAQAKLADLNSRNKTGDKIASTPDLKPIAEPRKS